LGVYEQRLREVVLWMKLPQHQITAYHMGRLLALHHRRHPALQNLDLLLPMPKHWTERIRRGTNAAEWIARGIGSVTGTPVANSILIKVRPTRKQSLLSETQRKGNLRDALAVACVKAVERKTVLLVDDLLTTGASANEAARVLRRAKAARICVAVVARAQSLRPSEKVGAVSQRARVE
jgi:predicted amidophosphoribosyltransferase